MTNQIFVVNTFIFKLCVCHCQTLSVTYNICQSSVGVTACIPILMSETNTLAYYFQKIYSGEPWRWRHDNQHNDIDHNETQNNSIKYRTLSIDETWHNAMAAFFVPNLRIFVISQSVCPWQAFPVQYNVCGQGNILLKCNT